MLRQVILVLLPLWWCRAATTQNVDMRQLIHFSPQNQYLSTPSAMLWMNKQWHIYYVKGANENGDDTLQKDWGHLTITTLGDQFVPNTNSPPFLSLDDDPGVSFESGTFLDDTSALVKGCRVLIYETFEPMHGVGLRTRLIYNPQAAEKFDRKPNGGVQSVTQGPLLYPSAFIVDEVPYLAFVSLIRGIVEFLRLGVDGDTIMMDHAGWFLHALHPVRSLQVFPLNTTTAMKYVVCVSHDKDGDGLFYPYYWVGQFSVRNQNLVFKPEGGLLSYHALDFGHDGTDWKFGTAGRQGNIIWGVGLASNNYSIDRIPTRSWTNGLTNVRSFDFNGETALLSQYSYWQSQALAMKEIARKVVLDVECTPLTTWVFTTGDDYNTPGAYEVSIELSGGGGFMFDGGIVLEIWSSSRPSDKMIATLEPSVSETTPIYISIERRGLVPHGYPTFRRSPATTSQSAAGRGVITFVVDRASVEFYLGVSNAGAHVYAISENYVSTTLLNTLCLRTVAKPQKGDIVVRLAKSTKYAPIYTNLAQGNSCGRFWLLVPLIGALFISSSHELIYYQQHIF